MPALETKTGIWHHEAYIQVEKRADPADRRPEFVEQEERSA